MTNSSCAVKLLDSCRTSFPLWLAVWRLTAGLSSRPPPYSTYSHHPFPLTLNYQLPTSSSSRTTALRDNIVPFVTVNGNIQVSGIRSITQRHADDEKQHAGGGQVQSQPKQEHNFHNSITWRGKKFLNCFEMMAKYMNDLMSKYLLSRNVSRKKNNKTQRAMQQWFPPELDGDSPNGDRDEGSCDLIDFSAASKQWFSVQAQLSFMEGLLSPDTCSGIDATGPPANIPPLWNQNELPWSLNKT